ncbi:phosphoribosylformylglycinamidine synthase subunit PurQ [Pseudoruegeria sp. HB172150]|uniref:phosphoribosylformylglycinamidine synthase subunit PurQ n=1 Tax=Pseudoruegeria sp. HB172150 TaxID=2721164 RepID=UPI001554940B|nr:phosphoribosylformylglycinamidine synthase subunit PurQ [Pseudoruegeria sp. HB172150]
MKAAVIVYPGSNCDRDLAVAFERAGAEVQMVWHKETDLPAGLDIVGVPGGFSYGDYLRCGAIAAQSPISKALIDFVHAGGHAIGICNGFQVLTETGLLPGALMRNAGLKFICKSVGLRVATADSVFTRGLSEGDVIHLPVAHHDGNYIVAPDELKTLQDQDRIAFTYTDNPNGSVADIAGVLSENRRVLGLMPHPERAVDDSHGGSDGTAIFRAIAGLTEPA